MTPAPPLPRPVTAWHRRLLAVVVAAVVVFGAGALVLVGAGLPTPAASRMAAYLLLGAAAVLVATFVVAYITLRLLQRWRGGTYVSLRQGP